MPRKTETGIAETDQTRLRTEGILAEALFEILRLFLIDGFGDEVNFATIAGEFVTYLSIIHSAAHRRLPTAVQIAEHAMVHPKSMARYLNSLVQRGLIVQIGKKYTIAQRDSRIIQPATLSMVMGSLGSTQSIIESYLRTINSMNTNNSDNGNGNGNGRRKS